jgi:hypothetical protein
MIDPDSNQRRLAAEAERILANASPLTRAFCPSREDLVGTLSLADTKRREAHLLVCPLCREDLADLTALERVPELEPGLLGVLQARLVLALQWAEDQAQRAVRVIESTLEQHPQPALAPARGEAAPATGVVVHVPCGDAHLEVTVGWASLGPGAEARSGADLRAVAREGALRPYRLSLRDQADTLLESRSCDADGVVTLSGLEPGQYLLVVHAPRSGDVEVEVSIDLRAPGQPG